MAASGRCALVLLLSALGCAGLLERAEQVLAPERKIDFDRPTDLVAPEGLRVTSTPDRQVALSWEPVLVGDVAGYVITRAREASGPYLQVGRTSSRFARTRGTRTRTSTLRGSAVGSIATRRRCGI